MSLDYQAIPSLDVTDYLTPSSGRVFVRLAFPFLTVRALAQAMFNEGLQGQLVDHLRPGINSVDALVHLVDSWFTPHHPAESAGNRYAIVETLLELVASGAWTDGIRHMIQASFGDSDGLDFRVLRQQMLDTLPDLMQFQRDRTIERLSHSTQIPLAVVKGSCPDANAAIIAGCFGNRKLLYSECKQFNLFDLLSSADVETARRVGNQIRCTNGPQLYRLLTDEQMVSPGGTVRSRLIWAAARYESIRGTKEDLLKQVIVGLAAKGYAVVAVEENAVVAEIPFVPDVDHIRMVEQIADLAARVSLPDVLVESKVTCPALSGIA